MQNQYPHSDQTRLGPAYVNARLTELYFQQQAIIKEVEELWNKSLKLALDEIDSTEADPNDKSADAVKACNEYKVHHPAGDVVSCPGFWQVNKTMRLSKFFNAEKKTKQ